MCQWLQSTIPPLRHRHQPNGNSNSNSIPYRYRHVHMCKVNIIVYMDRIFFLAIKCTINIIIMSSNQNLWYYFTSSYGDGIEFEFIRNQILFDCFH